MSSASNDASTNLTIAERVQWHRRRRGLSRRALAELMGRSEEWLRLLETQGRGAERVGTLLELMRVLRLEDMGALLGHQVAVTEGDRARHPQAEAIRRALVSSMFKGSNESPIHVPGLRHRVEYAWTAWRTSRQQYSALGLLLPDLIGDAASALHRPGRSAERVDAHVVGAHVFLLTQRFAFCVGETELAARSCDRALSAAREAGDRDVVGLAAWSMAMTSLATDRPEEAVDIALSAEQELRGADEMHKAMLRGSLLLFASIGHARARRPADAWRCWDAAAAIYAVALAVEVGDASAALDRGRDVHSERMSSTNRRAQHYLDLARSHQRRNEWESVSKALTCSLDASQEAILFDPHARSVVTELIRRRPVNDDDVARLGRHLKIL